ncbi:sensor histidine kinase [Kordiimonas gwangyangensis]|uniref:sensor histidine kinase n=2 Tax=Kordiimonas gwangyangensis TaxID=288022 RepID=UPI000367D152|nr:ATP-binding protein [Kordiimonas gwangyangensis]
MREPFKEYQGLLNERSTAAAVIFTLALMWSVGQVTFIGSLFVGAVAGAFLLQLEIKRRMERLENRRSAIREKRKSKSGSSVLLGANALDRLPSPLLLVDGDKKIAFANESARELLGSDIVGNDAFLYLRQSNFVAALDNIISGKYGDFGVIRYTTSKDRSFDVTVAPVLAGKMNDGVRAIVYFYEVTSLLRTERMRADFVANASHELRTPLTSVLGFIETLRGPAVGDMDAHARFLGIMQTEAERMVRLIDDLLSLSRIEMTRYMAPNATADVNKLVMSVINTLKAVAAERGIELKYVQTDGVQDVVADSDQITQVLLNLLTNAAKYADPNTTVTVTAELGRTGKHVILSISDEGPGIAQEHLARLTERFYRVDTARSRKMGGTGLGLAIVKHILLRHNSPLDIKSQLGTGTTFSFKLPIPQKKSQET